MRRRMLKTWLICCCVACCFGSLVAQGPGGHPPGPPPGSAPGSGPGGHPPGFPPGGAAPPSNGGGGGIGAPPRRANVTSQNGLKLGPPGRWWDDKSFVQAVGLSREQQKKMDTIFNQNKPAIIETYKTFEKQQAALAAISKDPNADKAKLFAAIDAVNEARAALQKANTEMLLEIRQQLDAGQVERLEKIP